MGDGGFPYFLLLIFVFWILESVAKARRRARLPEETQEDEFGAGEQSRMELPLPDPSRAERTTQGAGARRETVPREVPAPAGQVDTTGELRDIRDVFRELSELARGQRPGEEATDGPLSSPPTPAKGPVPISTRRQQGPTPVPPGDSKWDRGAEREVALAREGRMSGDQGGSSAWRSGAVQQVTLTPEGLRLARGGVSRPVRVGLRESRRSLKDVDKVAELAPVAVTVQHLARSSRAELRRIFVLQEVLSQPVSLRDKELGTPPTG